MACTIQKQGLEAIPRQSSITSVVRTQKQRGSLPTDIPPLLEPQWPPVPVSMHTSQLRLTMMNEDPKDLHTARLIINELRTKIRCQSEHIMKWRKAYAQQIQQHFRYQKEKKEQLNALTSQLLLLESRLKRKQKQIGGLLIHRELTINRQQRIIDTLSGRLMEHGIETNEATYAIDGLDSLNDSDSAVVLEDIDSDTNTTLSKRRRSSGGTGGGGGGGGVGLIGGVCLDGITVARSISDAIDTSLSKYAGVRRNNCFLRRPEILETVYSVEEDPEPTSDVAEKRDKFKNRSEKALSSSSTEVHVDEASEAKKDNTISAIAHGLNSSLREPSTPVQDGHTVCSMIVPQISCRSSELNGAEGGDSEQPQYVLKNIITATSQVTKYNRVMSNHRSVTKPKDVKYKRINKAKSKSLEELRGRLKDPVEHSNSAPANGLQSGMVKQCAQSYA